MSASIKSTKLFYRLFVATLFFLTFKGIAKPTSPDTATNQLRADIDELAKKRDLNVSEWLAFVNGLDTRCDKETDPARKESVCSLYYEIYLTGDLFSNSTPTADECLQAKATMESLSKNPGTSKSLKEIVEKLCLK